MYFPREILPISVVTSEAVNFLISTIIIVAFVLFSGLGITKELEFSVYDILVRDTEFEETVQETAIKIMNKAGFTTYTCCELICSCDSFSGFCDTALLIFGLNDRFCLVL